MAGGNYSPIIDFYPQAPLVLTPITHNPSAANSRLGYTATVADASILAIAPLGPMKQYGTTYSIQNGDFGLQPSDVGGQSVNWPKQTVKAIGTSFQISPSQDLVTSYSPSTSTITIVGNETGGKLIITVKVKPALTTPPYNPGSGGN